MNSSHVKHGGFLLLLAGFIELFVIRNLFVLGVAVPLSFVVLVLVLPSITRRMLVFTTFIIAYIQDISSPMQHGSLLVAWAAVVICALAQVKYVSGRRQTQLSMQMSTLVGAVTVFELVLFVYNGGVGDDVFVHYLVTRLIVACITLFVTVKFSKIFYKRMAG